MLTSRFVNQIKQQQNEILEQKKPKREIEQEAAVLADKAWLELY